MVKYDNEGFAIVYHVTPMDNLSSILKNGLVPQIGERSKEIEETPLVFFFVDKEACDNALSNWLGELFDESVSLAMLELHIPSILIHDGLGEAEYECVSFDSIPPIYINKIYDESFKEINVKSLKAMSNIDKGER